MTPREHRAAFTLASIFSLRMMGLFMILPVFSLYAETLESQPAPILIGVAIGVYGLTQAMFQIPFGMLSDRIGRKKVITIGLIIFSAGSVVAAMSDTIEGIIIGRALQGSGAIAAAVMALTADLTREEHRTKAMAVIGLSIGLSFTLSLVLGPVLNHWIGVPGIFWLTSVLALLGIAVLYLLVPEPVQSGFHRDTEPVPAFFSTVLKNRQLLRLDYGIFTLHMILTATFVVLPFALRDYAGLETVNHWQVYLPVMLISLALMIPMVIVAEKYHKMKMVFVSAIFLIMLSELGLVFWHDSLTALFLMVLLFFIAFNVLEALLPSLVVKFTPADKKGTAMGVYSTSQFLGAFCGGIVGGSLYGAYGLGAVFGFCALGMLAWGLVARTMENPLSLSSYMIKVGPLDDNAARVMEQELAGIEGVIEVTIVPAEETAYMKIDRKLVEVESFAEFSVDEEEDEVAPNATGS